MAMSGKLIGHQVYAHNANPNSYTQWGNYKIDSTLSDGGVEGVVGPRRIGLFELSGMQLVQITWSQTNGDYQFLYTKGPGTDYFVVAVDHMDVWNLAGAYKPPQVIMWT